MTPVDVLGFCAMGIGLTGQALIAHKKPIGWAVRVFGGLAWIYFALWMRSPPLVVTSVLHIGIDLFGHFKNGGSK